MACLLLSPHSQHRTLHPFPTRRSSDLMTPQPWVLSAHGGLWLPVSSAAGQEPVDLRQEVLPGGIALRQQVVAAVEWDQTDRKSTRLNSSHPSISYAVFCLKKKTTNKSD